MSRKPCLKCLRLVHCEPAFYGGNSPQMRPHALNAETAMRQLIEAQPDMAAVLYAVIERARQAGYDAGYADGSASGSEPTRDLSKEVTVGRLPESGGDDIAWKWLSTG